MLADLKTLPKLVLIVGPTGSGKSELGLRLAESKGLDIISADSQQVYKGMDIGTGKLSIEERRGVEHHLLDVKDPKEEMTTASFMELADEVIQREFEKNKDVVVVGGTMLYIRTLVLGMSKAPGEDTALRQKWQAVADEHGAEKIRESLKRVDPELAKKIEVNDAKRLIRAMEVFESSGIPLSQFQKEHNFKETKSRYPCVWFGIKPPKEILNKAIDVRVLSMMEQGFLDEVKTLRNDGVLPTMRSQLAIGYQELHQVLDGDIDLDSAVSVIQKKSRKYGRRQLSWYRDHKNIKWMEKGSELDLGTI